MSPSKPMGLPDSSNISQSDESLEQLIQATLKKFFEESLQKEESESSLEMNRAASPSSSNVTAAHRRGVEMGWQAALRVASSLLTLKYRELPSSDRDGYEGQALERVYGELHAAMRRGSTYSPPERLDERKHYARRLRALTPIPTTIREAILARLPKRGGGTKVDDVKESVVSDGFASSPTSVLNEIKRMQRDGTIEVRSQKGGRVIARATSAQG